MRKAILILDDTVFRHKGYKTQRYSYLNYQEICKSEKKSLKNIYAHNQGPEKYLKQRLKYFNKDINSNKIVDGDFNTTLSPSDRQPV